jgi:hypothetical protein
MNHRKGCIICGKDLIYKDEVEDLLCVYCHKVIQANVTCTEGHYICDQCHSASANAIIETYCINSNEINPLELAVDLMNHPSVKMHGPEHHFLVPAVLLATFYNRKGNPEKKKKKIVEARRRAEKVLGGFCGTHGTCGSAMGTGIFLSLITNTTPLSKESWKESNMMTAEALSLIAEHGGPRCCKRSTFLAIKYVNKHLGFDLDEDIKCEFSDLNKECKRKGCLLYQDMRSHQKRDLI